CVRFPARVHGRAARRCGTMAGGNTRRLGRLSVTVLALAVGWLGLGVPTLAADQPAAEPSACLIVDTDVGLDDYRALAILLPRREVRAVVVTEGISSVPGGATALSMFLASRGQTPPVIPGLASPTPPAYDWLPAVRAGAERMNNFLHAAIPFAGNPDRLTHDVGAATRGCAMIDVLALGPWSSYLRYASALGRNVHVIASGRSFAENNPDNFNCEYDLPACRTAAATLNRARGAVFVDLPPIGAELTYSPTEAMVAQLDQAGMPGLLRAALRVDPTQWLDTRLWDDAAALYLLTPQTFTPHDQHLEPAIPQNQFRALVVNAINGR
ncbi:MAG: hypothetical protein LC721_08825, partial [Actinobacteria bacterium]|nr:hypothetical protein [Actinomycetota bacterium]